MQHIAGNRKKKSCEYEKDFVLSVYVHAVCVTVGFLNVFLYLCFLLTFQ